MCLIDLIHVHRHSLAQHAVLANLFSRRPDFPSPSSGTGLLIDGAGAKTWISPAAPISNPIHPLPYPAQPWSSRHRLWDASGHRRELKTICDAISQALHSLNGSYPPARLNLALGHHTTIHEEKRKKTVSHSHLSLGIKGCTLPSST